MEFLYFLEGLRTPAGDAFFSLITHLGEETVFILAGLVVFWCIDKLQGYYLLCVGLAGTSLNQLLKLVFRVPRPWVKDPAFSIVESARAEATGYSFPSGHTQSSVGIFAGLARWNKNRVLRGVCAALCVLVPLSRMYLGVHSLADVSVSVLLALLFVFAMYPAVARAAKSPRGMRILLAVITAGTAAALAFVSLYAFPADVDADNLAHGIESLWKMMGCTAGLWLAFELDTRVIRFDTRAVWWAQLLKLALGAAILLGIKSGLKPAINALCGGMAFADGVRYFLIVVFAGCIWPLTFQWFAGLGGGKKSSAAEKE
ncbi:MAG: phosphatase PAP2 family protein [Oscillospiraceae bacterium]|nr:phosphatase PAP2 family protein [Oscillospiraceae bacterium]